MKLPTSLVDRPGRTAVAVGAMVAVSTTTAVALSSATAAADEPGRCTENVNVRAEPDVSSEIVALCEAGSAVQIGETRDGFVQLVEHDGWAAQQFVSPDGDAPAPDEREPGNSDDSDDEPADSDDNAGSSDSDSSSSDSSSSSGGSGGSGGSSSGG